MKIKNYILILISIFIISCNADDSPEATGQVEEEAIEEETMEEEMEEEIEDPQDNEEPTSATPNILLIIADDMGLDSTPGYPIGAIKSAMPNLQNMMDTGIRFNNLWSNPECTPNRASILTGKHGFRTNVTQVVDVLSPTETSIQSYLDTNTNEAYAHAVIGKWHLSNNVNHPATLGVSHFAGLSGGGVNDYSNWTFVENGVTTTSNEYTTTKLTDIAVDWINDQSKPWFLWLAYNAPHVPFHVPPADLHSQGALADNQAAINANSLPYYLAAIEAMDTEIGRLLASMSPAERDNTLIMFIGDNGTPNQVRQEYANRRVKGSIYQGGINVPMIVSGALVDRMNETEDALIVTTDFFATIADVAGTSTEFINDSYSFKELLASSSAGPREFAYTEIGLDGGGSDYAIRNATHKYIMFGNGDEAFFDLSVDAMENDNLLGANRLPLSAANNLEFEKLIEASNTIRN